MKGRGDPRMDGMADSVKPITPMVCPRCGKKVIFEANDRIRCEDCGALYFDNWLGIWRIDYNADEVHED